MGKQCSLLSQAGAASEWRREENKTQTRNRANVSRSKMWSINNTRWIIISSFVTLRHSSPQSRNKLNKIDLIVYYWYLLRARVSLGLTISHRTNLDANTKCIEIFKIHSFIVVPAVSVSIDREQNMWRERKIIINILESVFHARDDHSSLLRFMNFRALFVRSHAK